MGQKEFRDLCAAMPDLQDPWRVEPQGGTSPPVHRFEMQPRDFLAQAEVDLSHQTRGGDHNAFLNARRAIAATMDTVLQTFGFDSGRWNTPRKTETIVSLGLTAPRILRKLTDRRNLLEHEYRAVERSDAEDGVDLATLFVSAVEPVLAMFPGDLTLGVQTADERDAGVWRECLYISFAYDGSRLFRIGSAVDRDVEVTLSASYPSFAPMVAVALAADRGIGVEASLATLRASVTPGT